MAPRLKALITLIVIAPVFTEMVSGNQPAHAFLNPRIIVLLILAYSFPLLIIREVALRWRLANGGVFLFGLGYGIVNEGLLAQTLLRWEHVPIDKFDHYIYFGGFNISWACVIVPWHALFAVIFPLFLVARWFPSCAETLWLGKKTFAALTSILIGLLLFVSLVRPPHVQMLACLLSIAAFVFLAFLLRNRKEAFQGQKLRRAAAFLFGMIAYPVFFLGAIILAAKHVSPPVFFLFLAGVLIAAAKISSRCGFLFLPGAAYLALGAYFSVSVFNLIGGIAHHSLEVIFTGAILATVFLFFAMARKKGKERQEIPLEV